MSPETGDIGKAIPAMVYFKKSAKNEPALYSGPQNDEEIEEFTKGALANPRPSKDRPPCRNRKPLPAMKPSALT